VLCEVTFGGCDEAFCNALLAAILPSNSTVQCLDLGRQSNDGGPDLSPVFSALRKNTGLKKLIVGGFGSMGESLCLAIKDGLGINAALESLELHHALLLDTDLWCKAFSFLRTNKALKNLNIYVESGSSTDSCVAAFRTNIAAMLQENASLESLSIRKSLNIVKAEEHMALVTALRHNMTLKSLNLKGCQRLTLTHDEDKRMASLLKNNFALEILPGISLKNLKNRAGDVGAILRLNAAGRRYLVQDGSSVSKGVKVLISVNEEINCLFLHLLENPRLCDRRAVEMAGDSIELPP
jgi:hypothetical protein